MSNNLFLHNRISGVNHIPQAVIEFARDVNAERLVIMDRYTMAVLHCWQLAQPSTTLVVPIRYATSQSLLVVMLDDDGDFDCEGIDYVAADIIGTTINHQQ